MAEVWLVTIGAYSDYQVVCAAPDEATADLIAAAIPGGASVESVPMRTEPPVVRDRLHVNGLVYADRVETGEGWPHPVYGWDDDPDDTDDPRRVYVHARRGLVRLDGDAFRLSVSGTDPERVRKVYSERAALLFADFPIFMAATEPGQMVRFT